jgi:hypothetical protein
LLGKLGLYKTLSDASYLYHMQVKEPRLEFKQIYLRTIISYNLSTAADEELVLKYQQSQKCSLCLPPPCNVMQEA